MTPKTEAALVGPKILILDKITKYVPSLVLNKKSSDLQCLTNIYPLFAKCLLSVYNFCPMSSMLFAFKSRISSDMCFLVSRSRLDFLDVAKIEDSKKCRPWDTCCVGSDGDVIPLPDGCFCADHVPEIQKRARKLPNILLWIFLNI